LEKFTKNINPEMMQPLNRTTAGIQQTRPIKVLQFGEGNFMRGFVDWMIDTMNASTSFYGDVQMVQPIGHGLGEKINAQEGLYHVVLQGVQGGKVVKDTRLITCVRGVINPYTAYEQFLHQATHPDLQFILSNTTEAGISFDEHDKDFTTCPASFPAKLTALLQARFSHYQGHPPRGLTVIPCELIDKNGEALQRIVLQYAALWHLPEEFSHWVADEITFCNTLVDRIVPGYPKDTIHEIHQSIGYADEMVVMAEPFHLWVIEPKMAENYSLEELQEAFPARKAGLDVLWVPDQAPYRTRKVRILNGAHTALVPVAYLHGLRTVRESVEDPHMGPWLRKVMMEEIVPTLDLPREELESFAESVLERFQNPSIRHELASIALNSISKFKVRVLPSLLSYAQQFQRLPQGLVRSLAALILFYRGTFGTTPLPLNDTPEVLELAANAWSSGDPAQAAKIFLAQKEFWEADLGKVNGLTESVIREMEVLTRELSTSA
jgi:tagaturonate reductase